MLVSKQRTLFFTTLLLILCFYQGISAQIYNQKIDATIITEPSSEFLTFKARVENKTKVDYPLTYEYSIFTTNQDSTVSKSSNRNQFFLQSGERKIVNNLTLNYNFTKKTILLLLIYDENEKILGKDRIVLEEGGRSNIDELTKAQVDQNIDQAAPQDGFIPEGYVLQKSLTKSGRDFFRYFHSKYLNTQVATEKTILIQETFGRGINTRIIVKVEDQIVHQFFAQPRKSFLTQQADLAFTRVIQRLQDLEKQKDQFIRY